MKVFESVIKRLAPRWFVLRDAHAGTQTVLFQPRFAMSLLRGPMTRQELVTARRASAPDEAPKSRRVTSEAQVPHASP